MRRTERGSAASRGYDSRWAKYRLAFLRRHPLCIRCRAAGQTTPASVVDHIQAHKGDQSLFWDKANHQALCAHCHNADKQRAEKSGAAQYRGSSPDGSPLDPRHPWNGVA